MLFWVLLYWNGSGFQSIFYGKSQSIGISGRRMGYLQKQELGKWGEQIALRFLITQAVGILAANFRTRHGEIDLIGSDGTTLIFFEVKTRQSLQFGSPDQAVSGDKMKHIMNTAMVYISKFYTEEPLWRIDIISINRNPKTEQYTVQWIKNAEA